MDGLLRLSAVVWIDPGEITAVRWEHPAEDDEGSPELRVYHPDAAPWRYFVVIPDLEFDVIRALGIERPDAKADGGGRTAEGE